MRRRILVSLLTIACAAAATGIARAATITVTTTSDVVAVDGAVSFREAYNSINAGASANADVVPAGAYGVSDTIAFNITGGCAVPCKITASTFYAVMSKSVVIDGYTQPGSSANTLAVGDNALIKIEIDGNSLGFSLFFFQGSGTTVRGLNIHGVTGGSAIAFLASAAGSVVEGCFIGTNPAGTAAAAPTGVAVSISSVNAVIGGPLPANRNVISGTSLGIDIANQSSGIVIQGNYIGTNAAGTGAIPNNAGISGSSTGGSTVGAILIGGPSAGQGNVISGNAGDGIFMEVLGGTTIGLMTIQGNLIGTDASGTLALGNGGYGINFVNFAATPTVAGALVGGPAAGNANVIAFNAIDGVLVNAFTNVGIEGNSIHDNAFQGIHLAGGANPLLNDACDADTGSNNLQNYPVLTAASIAGSNVTISGTLNSTASTAFRVEFFSNTACDASGFGEGRTFLGSTVVTTDASCNATFGPLAFAVPAGQTVFTSTATGSPTNTSQFSACFVAGGVLPSPTPTPTVTPIVTGTPIPPTVTPTGPPAPTGTPFPGAPPTAVPTLSEGALALFGIGLAALALLLIRRR
ncbi:MAG: hypothetical protein ABI682_05355 [Acidobacteriota bacterium]